MTLHSRIAAGAVLLGLAAVPHADASRLGPSITAISAYARGSAVAYDSKNGVYLIVSALGSINGRFMTADGQLVGSQFVIFSNITSHFPRVAYSPDANGGAGGFLVTWHESGPAGGATPHVRTVAYNGGSPVLGPWAQLTTDGSWWEAGANVAYSTVSKEFLVTWQAAGIRAHRVSNTGAPLGLQVFVTPTSYHRDPSVAYNPVNNEFLVVYCGYDSSAFAAARRVAAGTGALVGTPTALNRSSGTYISDVAYNAAHNTYLATWYDLAGGTVGRVLNASGAAVSNLILLSARFAGNDSLGVAYNSTTGTHMVVAHDSQSYQDGAIEVNGDGLPRSAGFIATDVPTVVGNFYPRVAARTDAGEWLLSTATAFTSTTVQRLQSGGSSAPPPPAAQPVLTAFFADRSFPVPAGTPTTFIATANGVGSLEYQFWRWSYPRRAWTLAQDWSTNNQHVWNPATLDGGWHKYQVWVRQAGGGANPADWREINPFFVRTPSPRLLSLRVSSAASSPSGAAAINAAVTATATATGGMTGLLEYQFWRYNTGSGRWILDRPWSTNQSYEWMPGVSDEGTHYFQVWVRESGQSGWQDWLSAELRVSGITVTGVTPQTADIVRGNPINFSVSASGSSTGYEYKFWRYNVQGGAWVVAREYSSNSIFQWVPTTGELGQNYFQVWVRRAGSNAVYADWTSTGVFNVH